LVQQLSAFTAQLLLSFPALAIHWVMPAAKQPKTWRTLDFDSAVTAVTILQLSRQAWRHRQVTMQPLSGFCDLVVMTRLVLAR
jgi:hypothetical protein